MNFPCCCWHVLHSYHDFWLASSDALKPSNVNQHFPHTISSFFLCCHPFLSLSFSLYPPTSSLPPSMAPQQDTSMVWVTVPTPSALSEWVQARERDPSMELALVREAVLDRARRVILAEGTWRKEKKKVENIGEWKKEQLRITFCKIIVRLVDVGEMWVAHAIELKI